MEPSHNDCAEAPRTAQAPTARGGRGHGDRHPPGTRPRRPQGDTCRGTLTGHPWGTRAHFGLAGGLGRTRQPLWPPGKRRPMASPQAVMMTQPSVVRHGVGPCLVREEPSAPVRPGDCHEGCSTGKSCCSKNVLGGHAPGTRVPPCSLLTGRPGAMAEAYAGRVYTPQGVGALAPRPRGHPHACGSWGSAPQAPAEAPQRAAAPSLLPALSRTDGQQPGLLRVTGPLAPKVRSVSANRKVKLGSERCERPAPGRAPKGRCQSPSGRAGPTIPAAGPARGTPVGFRGLLEC